MPTSHGQNLANWLSEFSRQVGAIDEGTTYDQLNSSFIEASYDWITIQRNAGSVVCLSGENDPYVPAEQGVQLATNLGVKSHILPRGGHLNAEFGYTSFPELLDLINLAEA